MRPQRRKRIVRIGAVVVLLGAILPNVLWLGHWSVSSAAESRARHDHASHCHGSSSCTGQAAYGPEWWSDNEDTVVLDGTPELERAPRHERSPADPVVSPLDPPPRYA